MFGRSGETGSCLTKNTRNFVSPLLLFFWLVFVLLLFKPVITYSQMIPAGFEVVLKNNAEDLIQASGTIIPSYDHGVLAATSRWYILSDRKGMLLKLDSTGALVWAHQVADFIGTATIEEDEEHNIILAGADSTQNSYIVKLDSAGNVIWSKKCDSQTYFGDIAVIDTCYYLVGSIHYSQIANIDENLFVTKFDRNGNVLWSKMYDTHYNIFESEVSVSHEKKLVINGSISVGNSSFGTMIAQIDTSGILEWSKMYDLSEYTVVYNSSIAKSGNILTTGIIETDYRILFVMTDSLGNFIAARKYTNPDAQYGSVVFEKPDQSGYFLGVSSRNYLSTVNYQSIFMDLDANGLVESVKVADYEGNASYFLNAYPEENGVVSLSFQLDNFTEVIRHHNISADFPCEQVIEAMDSEELFPVESNLSLLVFDSLTYSAFDFTLVPLELEQTINCFDSFPGPPVPAPDIETVFVPNVFTPEGDGTNDFFFIDYPSSLDFHLTIMDRWGKIVFYADDPASAWDGNITSSGKPASAGVYFYLFEAGESKRHGTVTLVR